MGVCHHAAMGENMVYACINSPILALLFETVTVTILVDDSCSQVHISSIREISTGYQTTSTRSFAYD
jgi:hypothetical protein